VAAARDSAMGINHLLEKQRLPSKLKLHEVVVVTTHRVSSCSLRLSKPKKRLSSTRDLCGEEEEEGPEQQHRKRMRKLQT
jgi:hypothetical protein